MGLGFLMAGADSARYRVIFSGEVDPTYVKTLTRNHAAFRDADAAARTGLVPAQVVPLDLRNSEALKAAGIAARNAGGAHILIGGPPCQGFSNANRNSWHGTNPSNTLVDVFMDYVQALRPRVFLLENVQGIVWTARTEGSRRASFVERISRRAAAAGYLLFPKMLDAAWYGVPQFRSRFFMLGLHRDLGYAAEHFGPWGPFPAPTHGPGTGRPFVTVRQAIADLPAIGNGHTVERQVYRQPSARRLERNAFLALMRTSAPHDVIEDHVTSRHADYVIERYARIPEGGNWEDIVDSLTNYTDVARTHSNIYRRLIWSEPAITIGHYRKSMLVHPTQDRGLSLREAARLQSFPDWFRFEGGSKGSRGGLVHKQQQLANAVCPLVTRAWAEFLVKL